MKTTIRLAIAALIASIFSFSPKMICKVITTGVVVSTLESRAQFLTREEADTLYKPKNYVPVITDPGGGYSITIDGTTSYPLPPVDYNRDLQSKPVFVSLAFTARYDDIIFGPDLNHLPNYYEKSWCDTSFLWWKDYGYGLQRVSNKLRIDTTKIMSVSQATFAIATTNSNMTAKANKNTNITILSGTTSVTNDLAASCTFSLPAFLTSETQSLSITGQSLSIKSGSNTINTVSIPTFSTSYTGSTGISVSGSIITNTFPDVSVSLIGTGTSSVIGSYPNYTINSSSTQQSFIAGPSISITSSGLSNTITNISPDQVITLTAGNNDISITGTYPNFTLTPYVPTTYTVNRSINSSTFQISSNRHSSAIYNIGISCTANIGGNASGLVQLQYSINGGTTWINSSRIKNSNNVTLAITLQSVNEQEAIIAIDNIPVGAILKIVPTVVGTTTITSIIGFETY